MISVIQFFNQCPEHDKWGQIMVWKEMKLPICYPITYNSIGNVNHLILTKHLDSRPPDLQSLCLTRLTTS